MQKIAVAIVLLILITALAQAQNIRSAVSLSGTDAASCTVQDPCRTFGAAIARTDPGGEVIVLSSAGYGPFTVNKSVSIISPDAFHAALAPTAGTAITIDMLDNAVVVLRGLTLNGSLGGANGITFTGPLANSNTRLYVESCVISGFSNMGLNFDRNGTLVVKDTTVRNSGGDGIFIDGGTPGNPSRASIDHVLLEGNSNGLVVDNARVVVRDSIAAGNVSFGFWARADLAGFTAELSADNCQAMHNTYGFQAGGRAGTAHLTVSNSVASSNNQGIRADPNGTVRASNNTVSRNDAGIVVFPCCAVFESRENNTVRGNDVESEGPITPFGPV